MPKIHADASPGPERGRRGRRVASSLSEINVVPLVDVMLVLLIIFMVTAPMIQQGMDVNLPKTSRSNQIEGQRVFVTVPAAYQDNRVVYLGQEPVRIDALQERIRQQIEAHADKQVFLRGDGGVRYKDLVEVINRLQAAGVDKVGLVTEFSGER